MKVDANRGRMTFLCLDEIAQMIRQSRRRPSRRTGFSDFDLRHCGLLGSRFRSGAAFSGNAPARQRGMQRYTAMGGPVVYMALNHDCPMIPAGS